MFSLSHLRGNNIQCTCAIEWFFRYLNGNPILHNKSTVKCSSPPALNGDNVASLTTNIQSCGELELVQSGVTQSRDLISEVLISYKIKKVRMFDMR